ncbi:MAG: hypothetical protein EBR82_30195 [Caulobacteraceae bacterium]|nr:hypothetical protein [Caulobacteraceae bacterium]
MTAEEYIERIRTAKTDDAAYAVSREAYAAAVRKQITVEEWNAVWCAYDKRTRPYRYDRPRWTGD